MKYATLDDLEATVASDGFAIIEQLIDREEVEFLIAGLERLESISTAHAANLRRGGVTFGQRDLLGRSPLVRDLAKSAAVRSLVELILGPDAFAVRGLLFDKSPEANWGVPWHRDLTIAVSEKIETQGYTAWNRKAGIHHVQPPLEVLRRMLTLRIHLDDTGEENGPLRVLPGSHRLATDDDPFPLAPWIGRDRPINCLVRAGGVLLMRPLILHSSRPALQPLRRRVIHLEFAVGSLPGNVRWYEHIEDRRSTTPCR
jgi:ectoine hydroxylase-related dioxygenase (phytanoyl-CoA dioxygenase family)